MGILQDINDSQVGTVLGTVMHTLGAIAFLGGVIGYIAWHRHLRQGHHHRAVLQASIFLTYFAIVINLVGGFMRTYETGHPHFTAFASSPWVRALVIKHVFLFGAYIAAVILFEVVATRHLKAFKAGTLGAEPQASHVLGVAVVVLGVIVATFLGALTQVVSLGPAEPDMEDDHDHMMNQTTSFNRYANATGQLTSAVPTQPATARATFEVTEGTVSLNATLNWAPEQFCLRLNLLPPGETAVPQGGCAPNPGVGRRVVTIDAPQPGTWTFVIDSSPAVAANWDLSIRMPQEPSDQALLVKTVSVAPRAGYEINTQMPGNGTISWDWTSASTLHFNVHSHFDGQVQNYVDIDATQDVSAYTNNRTGGYSLYWTNSGAVPITLTYRVYGDFTLDSIFPA